MAVRFLPAVLIVSLCCGGRFGPDSSAAPCGLARASTCESKRVLGGKQEMRLQWGAMAQGCSARFFFGGHEVPAKQSLNSRGGALIAPASVTKDSICCGRGWLRSERPVTSVKPGHRLLLGGCQDVPDN